MERIIMKMEDMLVLGLDVDGDIIKSTKGEPIFVIADTHASSIMKENKEEQ